jgi:hypothetical protein
MESMRIEILNSKAKKLLLDLADLKLIAIKQDKPDGFLQAVKSIRAKKAPLSLDIITKEVEQVRKKNHGKKTAR